MTASGAPEFLYHYTSAASAIEILRGGELLASAAQFQNDPQEVALGVEMIARAVEVPSVEEAEADRALRAAVSEQIRRGLQNFVKVFTVSFSEHPDSLALWSRFSANGGYALGYRREDLASIQRCDLRLCSYTDGGAAAGAECLRDLAAIILTAAREHNRGDGIAQLIHGSPDPLDVGTGGLWVSRIAPFALTVKSHACCPKTQPTRKRRVWVPDRLTPQSSSARLSRARVAEGRPVAWSHRANQPVLPFSCRDRHQAARS